MPLDDSGGGLIGALGEGLRGAGAVLSPDVYHQQNAELLQRQQEAFRQKNFMGQVIAQGIQSGSIPAEQGRIALQRLGFGPAAGVVGPTVEAQANQRFLSGGMNIPKPGGGGLDPSMFVSPIARSYIAAQQRQAGLDSQIEDRKARAADREVNLASLIADREQRAEDRKASLEDRRQAREQANTFKQELLELKKAKSQPSADRDYAAEYAKLDPAGQKALDMQAWNYINKGILPYRKGTGGGVDRNDPIIHRAGQIAEDLGMSAQELAGKSAEFKSNAQSLSAMSKKLNMIQGTLESFHNNIATWDSIAEGEAPKIGGDKLASLGNELKKMDFSDVKTLNDWKLKIQTQLSDPSAVAYVTSAFTVAMDYSRIMSSQGQSAAAVTEGARDEALKLISAGYNRNARKALIGTLESETAGQVKGIETQTNRVRKKLGLTAEGETESPKETPKQPDLKSAVEGAGQKYEPEKYEYRVVNGQVQRRAKGAGN